MNRFHLNDRSEFHARQRGYTTTSCDSGTRAGRHLNERTRTTGGKGLFEIVDRINLRGPERASGQRGKLAEALGELLLLLHHGE